MANNSVCKYTSSIMRFVISDPAGDCLSDLTQCSLSSPHDTANEMLPPGSYRRTVSCPPILFSWSRDRDKYFQSTVPLLENFKLQVHSVGARLVEPE